MLIINLKSCALMPYMALLHDLGVFEVPGMMA